MAKRYLLTRRSNDILPYEIVLASVAAGILAVEHFDIAYGYGFLIFFLCACIMTYLFVSSRIFRYVFTILFSLGWAAGAFFVAQHINNAPVWLPFVVAPLALGCSLWAHRNDFKFYKEAEVVEYD